MTQPDTLAKLAACPFCGSDARIIRTRGESLWSHDQVEWTQVRCTNDDCAVETENHCEGWEPAPVDVWNRRALTAQALPAAPDLDAWKCERCNGKGWHWQMAQVGERESDQQEVKTHCDECEGLGWQGPDAQAAAAPPASAPNLAPGVMHCAKCKFKLIRNNLNIHAGTITAGDSKTEPCPNGCGPLWPVTWEQEARDAYKTAEDMFDRWQAAQQAAQAPAGWVPAPLEPTDAMLDAGKRETHSSKGAREKTLRIYRAMLSALPQPPHPQEAAA